MTKKSRNKIITNIILFFLVTGLIAKLLPVIFIFLIFSVTANLSRWLSK